MLSTTSVQNEKCSKFDLLQFTKTIPFLTGLNIHFIAFRLPASPPHTLPSSIKLYKLANVCARVHGQVCVELY